MGAAYAQDASTEPVIDEFAGVPVQVLQAVDPSMSAYNPFAQLRQYVAGPLV